MKSIKLHLIVLVIIVIAELIGNIVINVGIGKIVLLPMMYALIMGVLTAPKFTKISGEKEIHAASGLLGVTLVLLMARYGTLVGPTLPKILAASPALILQEFGNLGTVLIGIPLAVLIGLKREAIGAAHSVAREPNVALIGERYGLDAAEGRGVMGVYICGTVIGTIFFGLMASVAASYLPFHPLALAMAAGVGSASMMTAAVGSLSAMYPQMADQLAAFGAASNMLSGLDGIYMSIWLALPMSEWLYKICYRIKYGEAPPKREECDVAEAKEEEGQNETDRNISSSYYYRRDVLVANTVGTKNDLMQAIPGMGILIAIAFVGMWMGRVLPGKIPGVAYVVTLGCILTYPGFPGSDFINASVKNVGFLQLCTPILAYAGIAICKDLDVFAKSSWRIVLVSVVVFIGTYIGSAIIAQVILKSIGQI